MASLTWWTWVWVNSRSWWWTGRPGMLRFMGSQRVGHDWATDLIWSDWDVLLWSEQWLLSIHVCENTPSCSIKYVSLLTVVYMIRSAFSELYSPLGFILNWWWIPVLAKNPAKLVYWESPHHWYLIKLLILLTWYLIKFLFPDPWYLVKFIEVFFH